MRGWTGRLFVAGWGLAVVAVAGGCATRGTVRQSNTLVASIGPATAPPEAKASLLSVVAKAPVGGECGETPGRIAETKLDRSECVARANANCCDQLSAGANEAALVRCLEVSISACEGDYRETRRALPFTCTVRSRGQVSRETPP